MVYQNFSINALSCLKYYQEYNINPQEMGKANHPKHSDSFDGHPDANPCRNTGNAERSPAYMQADGTDMERRGHASESRCW
jgi:hypothetical protein